MRFSSSPHSLLRSTAAFLFCVTTAATLAKADQIILKNGDIITGTIDSAADGNLVITSPIAGKITVALSDVKTFSTDGPIKIELDNGTVLNQQISQAAAGEFSTAPGGLLNAPAIPVAKISRINPPLAVWTGSLVLNGLYAQGTTTSEQFGASVDATRRGEKDRLNIGGAYLFGRQKVNGVTTTTEDNWYLKGSYDYFFTKKAFGYANVRIEKDRIQLLDLRLTPGVGVGYQVAERPDFNLNFNGGLAWVYEQYSNVAAPNQNVSIRLAYHVDKTLWASRLKVFNDIAYFPSIETINDYLILSDAGVRLAMTANMFAELKAEVDYDSHPAPTAHRTTTQYILGVGWTF
jgi:putative salt-induced outer membrane protein YdiY